MQKMTMNLKTRRRFSQDFKDDAVRMVVMEGIELRKAAENCQARSQHQAGYAMLQGRQIQQQ